MDFFNFSNSLGICGDFIFVNRDFNVDDMIQAKLLVTDNKLLIFAIKSSLSQRIYVMIGVCDHLFSDVG